MKLRMHREASQLNRKASEADSAEDFDAALIENWVLIR
jgi:hypothetical protein